MPNFNKNDKQFFIIVIGIFIISGFCLLGRRLQLPENVQADNEQISYLPLILKSDSSTPTATPTNTSTPTNTPTVTIHPTITAMATPTHTPGAPYIVAIPSCSNNPTASFTIAGFNWPPDEDIVLFWDTTQFMETINDNQHNGSFTRIWTINGLTDGIFTIRAISQNETIATFDFTVPCAGPLPSTPTNTPPAPLAADLVIISPPTLLSQPPIHAYAPLDFSVVITNVGDIDINQQFFVDLYFDPTAVYSTHISPNESVGFVAVSGIDSGEVLTLTLRTNRGFENIPDPHLVYGMVDSVNVPGGQINEPDETNNVSNPLTVSGVIPQNTPTSTPTLVPTSSDNIAGIVQTRIIAWVPQPRADVYLFDTLSEQVIARVETDESGYYNFENVVSGTYIVYACLQNTDYFGVRTGIVPPNLVANIYMLPDHPGGCNLTLPTNNLPSVTNPGNQTNHVGDSVSLAITATDMDGDPLVFSATGLPPGLNINADSGDISGTLPQDSQGIYNVAVSVYDGQNATSIFFTWDVIN
ncbi:MAG: putative Ig domain-containing protein [Anaerolineales bacterium]|nr:putative Ig domain-containing protein [Anaerolineales bacterium]